jgi:hypothetical protein
MGIYGELDEHMNEETYDIRCFTDKMLSCFGYCVDVGTRL